MFGVEAGGGRGGGGSLHGKQLMVRSKGHPPGLTTCCSLNKAFIARMCVHDPKESRVTAVRATSERTTNYNMLF